MSRYQISFFSEETDFVIKQKKYVRQWIKETVVSEGFRCGTLNIVFCSDSYLLTINQQYLNHDTYTDIVTFDNSEEERLIEGDIFISVDRIMENAQKFSKSFANELHRVIIHGVLHLLGYTDKKKESKEKMTQMEDLYLSKITF